MTNYTLDNSADDLKKVVLWQYDNAHRLLALLQMMKTYYDAAIKTFWDTWIANVLTIDTCTEFGATVLGKILGASRPTIIGDNGTVRPVSLAMYRRFLRLQIRLTSMNATMRDIAQSYIKDGGVLVHGYLQLLFSVNDDYARCGVSVVDFKDMSIEFVKTDEYGNLDYDQKAVYEQLGDLYLPYPVGVKYRTYASQVAFSNRDLPTTINDGDSGLITQGKKYVHIENGAPVAYVSLDTFERASTDTWEDIKGHFTLLGISPYVSYKTALSPSVSSAEEYKPYTAYDVGDLLVHEKKFYNVTSAVTQESNVGWDTMGGSVSEVTQSVGLTDEQNIDGE